MTDTHKHIADVLVALEGLEYGLFDDVGFLQACSPGLVDFVFDCQDSHVQGEHITSLFPEMIGYEDVLVGIRSGQQPELRLARVHRANLRGQPAYIDLRLLLYQDCWLLVASDSTAVGLIEQRITQQRNDLSLLTGRLEQTRARLDDLLHRFLPGQVADVLLSNNQQVRLGGVRRDVTILFADVRGFTQWSAYREPEVVLAMLNSVFDSVLEILLDQGATIDKFIGDAVMAFFNAPNDQPDHALRAMYCAQQIRTLSFEDANLRFGIGVNSGPVVVGNVGAVRAMQYTVLGTTVNMTKRLEEQAGPGQVLLGPGFIRLAGEHCDYTEYGNLQLKGFHEPVKVYQLQP